MYISLYWCIFFSPPSLLSASLSPLSSCSDFLLLSASLVLLPSLCLSLCQPPPTWTRRANERPTSNRHGNSMWMCSARGVGRSVCRNCTRRLSWTYRVCCKVGESAAGASSVRFRATRGCVARSSACPDLPGSCVFVLFLWVCVLHRLACVLSVKILHFHSHSVFPSACKKGTICFSIPLSILVFSLHSPPIVPLLFLTHTLSFFMIH